MRAERVGASGTPAGCPGGQRSVERLARFCLVLDVTHNCNMRCGYCYAGPKVRRNMPEGMGRKAIDRAVASLRRGGRLDLGFFGGEPLLYPELVTSLIAHARERAAAGGVKLSLSLTTNGTAASPGAWAVMSLPWLALAVSHDGLPEVHDRYRWFADGGGSSDRVLGTIRRLVACQRDFRVVMVVRPDTVAQLPAGMRHLHGVGVRQMEPSLDLWAAWTREAAAALDAAVAQCARFWRGRLPEVSITWFDEKAALLSGAPMAEAAPCGFGTAQVAVTPAGRLYPCERLIGADEPGDPMRLPGGVFDGDDFLALGLPAACDRPGGPSCAACSACAAQPYCNATCLCSNYVRTGDTARPDGLLCLLNRACIREVMNVFHPDLPDAGPAEDARRSLVHWKEVRGWKD